MNPYKVLDLPTDASKFEVRNAYRQAAKKHHPDIGGDSDKFREISLAHDVLIDDERRARYDESGEIDETAANNADSEASMRFLVVISNALDRVQMMAQQKNVPPFSFDVLALAKIELVDHIEAVRKQIKGAERKLALNKSAALRFTRADGKDDIIGAMLSKNITALKATIASCEHEIAMTQGALEIFESYSFVKDPQPATMPVPEFAEWYRNPISLQQMEEMAKTLFPPDKRSTRAEDGGA